MLDFSCGIKGIPTIDLTKDEPVVCYPPPKGNIADDPEVPTMAPGPSNCHQTVRDEPFQSAAPPHTDSDVAPGTSSASALRIIPTTLLATDKQQFSPQSIGRLKALCPRRTGPKPSSRLEQRGLPLASMHMYPRMRQVKIVTYLMQKKTSKWSLMKQMIHRLKAQSQLKLTPSQTRKFQRLPTRRMVAKPRSLWTRNQLNNTATGPNLELEMVRSATIGTSLLMVIRTSIPRTISPFTAFRGQAELFS